MGLWGSWHGGGLLCLHCHIKQPKKVPPPAAVPSPRSLQAGAMQHAKGRIGDCPGPRKECATQRNVTQGRGVQEGTPAPGDAKHVPRLEGRPLERHGRAGTECSQTSPEAPQLYVKVAGPAGWCAL